MARVLAAASRPSAAHLRRLLSILNRSPRALSASWMAPPSSVHSRALGWTPATATSSASSPARPCISGRVRECSNQVAAASTSRVIQPSWTRRGWCRIYTRTRTPEALRSWPPLLTRPPHPPCPP